MKVLLDECVPVQVRHALPGHTVATAQQMGWQGLGNGDLLAAAESAGFDLFIIADKNLRFPERLAVLLVPKVRLWECRRRGNFVAGRGVGARERRTFEGETIMRRAFNEPVGALLPPPPSSHATELPRPTCIPKAPLWNEGANRLHGRATAW